MTIQTAREILGKGAKKLTDEQIQELINTFIIISDLAIYSYLEKRKNNKKICYRMRQ